MKKGKCKKKCFQPLYFQTLLHYNQTHMYRKYIWKKQRKEILTWDKDLCYAETCMHICHHILVSIVVPFIHWLWNRYRRKKKNGMKKKYRYWKTKGKRYWIKRKGSTFLLLLCDYIFGHHNVLTIVCVSFGWCHFVKR